jgi:hypothetical protein
VAHLKKNDEDVQDWDFTKQEKNFFYLMQPYRLLDIMQNFLLFTTNKRNREQNNFVGSNNTKELNKIVERVKAKCVD